MSKKINLNSEEDIRTKIVTEWLNNHGFKSSDISIEFSFEVQLGRNAYRIGSNKSVSSVHRPRADVLVRSCDGKNLLIVEVKALDEKLDDSVKKQGISYARLLTEGGIAPFVILTNGQETKIFDSISGELINGITIPTDHPYVKNGFKVSGFDLQLKTEALETFISLSPDNLLEFCRSQVSYQMSRLRSDDPCSGYKYIPAVYVERKEAKEKLEELIEDKKGQVIILIGSPQVGKTNFICHTVEEKLSQGIPCLFYPAIGIQQGLLEEICDDFQWIIGDNSSCHQIVKKLEHILQRIDKKLTIFIDGWNEATQNLARAIDKASERLSSNNIQIVVSLTNLAASRLLLDDAGNISYLAQSASIPINGIPVLEIGTEKLNKKWSVIYLTKYSSQETQQAYKIYSNTFQVKIPDKHKQVDDPFLLRIGMELYQNKVLPEILDEPILLEKSIELKASRAIDLKNFCVKTLLGELAEEIFNNNAPIPQKQILQRFGLPIVQEPPKGLFESALLAKVRTQNNLPAIDFYYGRERDFVIACWVSNWEQKFLSEDNQQILYELDFVIKTSVRTEALRWFLSQPHYQNCLKSITQHFSLYEDDEIKRIILSSIRESVSRGCSFSGEEGWVINLIEQGAKESNPLVKAEVAKLMVVFDQSHEWLTNIITSNEEIIPNLLDIDQEETLSGESIIKVIMDALKDFYIDHCTDYDEIEDKYYERIFELINHHSNNIRKNAIKACGYIFPRKFLYILSKEIKSKALQNEKDFICGIVFAIDELQDIYYGDGFCPSYIDSLCDSPDQLWAEYTQMYQICTPIISYYSSEKCSHCLLEILITLHPSQRLISSEEVHEILKIVNLDDFFFKTDNKISAYQSPKIFLQYLSKVIQLNKLDQSQEQSYYEDIKMAVISLQKSYFGNESIKNIDNCLLIDELDKLCNEYRYLYKNCTPIINFYYPQECSIELLKLLKELFNVLKNLQFKWDISENYNEPLPSIGDILVQKDQLSLPFDDFL